MLQVNMWPENRDLLVEIVEEYLSELRGEIGDTDDADYRSKLKAEEKAVRETLSILTQAQETSSLAIYAPEL